MNENDCGQIFALLSEYLDQELPPATCEQLEHHLADCPECIQFVESLKRSVRLCRQFGSSRPAPLPDAASMEALRHAYRDMIEKRRGQ